MTQVRTNGPRISPGWLAGLLAAEAHCEWASWFRVRHEDWEQRPMPGLAGLEWSVDYTQRLRMSRDKAGKRGAIPRSAGQFRKCRISEIDRQLGSRHIVSGVEEKNPAPLPSVPPVPSPGAKARPGPPGAKLSQTQPAQPRRE